MPLCRVPLGRGLAASCSLNSSRFSASGKAMKIDPKLLTIKFVEWTMFGLSAVIVALFLSKVLQSF
jgi:hypothetical protein